MIALDSSAVICLVEQIEPSSQMITELLAAASTRCVISTLVITECLTGPLRAGDQIREERFHRFFSAPHVVVLPIDEAAAKTAAVLRSTTKLKTPDAANIAFAIASRATGFLTTDADFARVSDQLPIRITLIPRPPRL